VKQYEEKRGSVSAQRSKLGRALEQLERPLLVIIDDIDRLETNEIRDIFKLVRLTASFPNVIYLLAFDRERVEQALTETGFDGRAYLEKIVQLGVDIPAIPDVVLLDQLTQALDAALNDLDVPERFDAAAWPDILAEIIFPLVRSMRDVRRYAAAARATTRALRGEIELVDVLALEATRVFLPASFSLLSAAREVLTSTVTLFRDSETDQLSKAQIVALLENDPEHAEILKNVVSRLFPGAGHLLGYNHYGSSWLDGWAKTRRVAHPDVLALYLERLANPRLVAFKSAEAIFAVLTDRQALESLLASLDRSSIRDVFNALVSFEHEFPPAGAVPGSIALLNALPGLPEPRVGMFDISNRVLVGRLVLRLLKRLPTKSDVVDAVASILPEVNSLSGKLELVSILQYGDSNETRLVLSDDFARIAQGLVGEVGTTSSYLLANEIELIGLMLAPKHLLGRDPIHVPVDDITLARNVLVKSASEVKTRILGNRAVSRTYKIPWDLLLEIFEGEDHLRQVVDDVRVSARDDVKLAGLVALADRYLTGWRPADFGDE